MDRRAANTALAKAIAYVECGKPEAAAAWLATLVGYFREAGVDVDYAARFSAPAEPNMSAASAWLGGRLLGREGSVQL